MVKKRTLRLGIKRQLMFLKQVMKKGLGEFGTHRHIKRKMSRGKR